ncbi:MAG: hypothetical protein SynsKO_32000 [Synoicihabitans sp.]
MNYSDCEAWKSVLERGYSYRFRDGSEVRATREGVSDSYRSRDSKDYPAFYAGSAGDSLWDLFGVIAEQNVQRNIVETDTGRYLGAGSDFGPKVFTRDIAFSGLLGLNALHPELMEASLQYTREVRRRAGFKVPRRFKGLGNDVPWEGIDLSDDEFVMQYGTNSYLNRTDDVCWIAALADLYRRHGVRADWAFLEAEGTFFFEHFYAHFFDVSDGLYRGQATFVDIGYPNPLGTGYADSLALAERVRIKALSTNCLYVWAMAGLAEAAERNGHHVGARKWLTKKDALVAAIRETFTRNDGTLSYYKSIDGRLELRRDALGSSLAVLTGVVRGVEARRALDGYPTGEFGVPLFDPFFPDPRWYHNHSSWPFVDAFFLRALSLAEGCDTRPLAAMWLGLACDPTMGFREVRDHRSGEIKGSGAQLWTAAAYLGLGQPWMQDGFEKP